MAKSKPGRKAKSGNRTRGNRLSRIQPPDRGNDKVQERRGVFAVFGKSRDHAFDPIGRAFACGLLENASVDPEILMFAGREYGDAYWSYFPNPKAVACYGGREPRAANNNDRDGQGEYFQRLDEMLDGAGRGGRDAVHEMVVNMHHFPDENPVWLQRLLNERLVRAGRPVCGMLPMTGDYDRLRLAVEGLLALVGKRG